MGFLQCLNGMGFEAEEGCLHCGDDELIYISGH